MGNDSHPCYSEKAHHKYYRLHLPVAVNCNLGCNYCERKIGGDSFHSYRPAATKKVLSPEEAFQTVRDLSKNPNLKVVGIAGPGEPLFNPETFEVLEKINDEFPNLILCISTNGLLVAKYAGRLAKLNIKSISITINSFEVNTLEKLYHYVYTEENDCLAAEEAARYIKKKQREAVQCLVQNNFTFKVNTILIPGINAEEMEAFARELKELGVNQLHNIIPFIPLGQLKHYPAPGCEELKRARAVCRKYIPQFCLCKQCSSDAFDIPGKVDRIPHWRKSSCGDREYDRLSDYSPEQVNFEKIH